MIFSLSLKQALRTGIVQSLFPCLSGIAHSSQSNREKDLQKIIRTLENKAKQIGLNVEKQLSHKKSFQPVKTPLSDLQPINPQIVKGVAQKYHCPVLDCNYGAKNFKKGNKFTRKELDFICI